MRSTCCLHCTLSCLLATLCLVASGCVQKDQFPRHRITGKVTYQGQSLEYGMLIFEPKESIGKIAPVCYAPVRNGAFEAPVDEGPTTGAYKVRVLGFDRSKLKPEQIVEDVPQLFPEYVLHIDVPPPEGRLDVDVPSARARKKQP